MPVPRPPGLEFENVPIPSEGLAVNSDEWATAIEEEARRYRRIVQHLKDGDCTVNVHLALVRVVCFGPHSMADIGKVTAAFRTEMAKIHARRRAEDGRS